jgi:hypothetical protein
VRRGATNEVHFDFRPRECAVEVSVHEDGRPVSSARVAVAGDRSSLRYARDGVAYLYLGKGEYTIRVGSKDAAAEFRVRIEHLEAAVPLHVDLAETDVVFRGCPAAVEPYLVGDPRERAEALHAAGNTNAARRLRARTARALGAFEGRRSRARGSRRSHPGRRAARVGRGPLEVRGALRAVGQPRPGRRCAPRGRRVGRGRALLRGDLRLRQCARVLARARRRGAPARSAREARRVPGRRADRARDRRTASARSATFS